jgi:hypothetical protein
MGGEVGADMPADMVLADATVEPALFHAELATLLAELLVRLMTWITVVVEVCGLATRVVVNVVVVTPKADNVTICTIVSLA